MPPSTLQHRRTHNLLLISKLLNQRDAASPFTLIIDDLEQSGSPLQQEFIKRAGAAKVKVIFVSFETLKRPKDVDAFIRAWGKDETPWEKQLLDLVKDNPAHRKVIVFDSLNTLAITQPANLPSLLSKFITPTTSTMASYHQNVPLPTAHSNPYAPDPLTQLKYIATTIFTVYSLHHVLAKQMARSKSHAEPSFGISEAVEGVVQGLGSNDPKGFVLEMLHRRKSGRGVKDTYFFPLSTTARAELKVLNPQSRDFVILLEDHPAFDSGEDGEAAVTDEGGFTFELGLTEKQKKDREGVVLPYTDAQQGGVEGGRILYDMGEEDDFDEEEDEI